MLLRSHSHISQASVRLFFALSRQEWFVSHCREAESRPITTARIPIPPPRSVISLCSSSQSLRQTKEIHSVLIVHGFLPSIGSVSPSLMLQYAQFGDSSLSFRLFKQAGVNCRTTAFLWNTLIRSFSIAGFHDQFVMYNQMIRSGVQPDDRTFPFVLKVCADYVEMHKGPEIHGSIVKLGFVSDIYVGNTLLLFYGRSRRSDDARRVFDEMPERDIVSWNTVFGSLAVNGLTVDALHLFIRMSREEDDQNFSRPNAATFVSLLPVCSELMDDSMAGQLHCQALKLGNEHDTNVRNALVDTYGKCRNTSGSSKVFREMDCRNVISWNAIIASFYHCGRNDDSVEMLRSMIGTGMRPDCVTISTALPLLVGTGYFKAAREVHQYSIRSGMDSDVFVMNSVIDMYAKSQQPHRASHLFRNLKAKNIVSWNTMISNLAQNGMEAECAELVRQMQAHGEIADSVTLANVLPVCARLGLFRAGKEIHGRSIRTGTHLNIFVSNAVTDMYAKCGRLNLARSVFEISERDEVTYNVLIAGYSGTGGGVGESLRLFAEMELAGLVPDPVTYTAALSACVNVSCVGRGREIHGRSVRRCTDSHLHVANSLMELYTKCGYIDAAESVFGGMPEKDAASWNTMILGYGTLGQVRTAVEVFEKMKETTGHGCDSVAYVAVLTACSHGGLVEEGRRYFAELEVSGKEVTSVHFACMVCLLGRAGLVEEAADLASRSEKTVADSTDVWSALLGACRMHANVEVGRWAAMEVMNRASSSMAYVLLANVYAEAGSWFEVDRLRRTMKCRKVKKANPGLSCLHPTIHPSYSLHSASVNTEISDDD